MHDGKLHLMTQVYKSVYETKDKEVDVEGVKKQVPYTVQRLVPETKIDVVEAEQFRVYTVAGKQTEGDALQTLLSKDTEALVLSHGKLIDPAYARLFGDDVPVVYLRPQPLHAFGPPINGPVPAPHLEGPAPALVAPPPAPEGAVVVPAPAPAPPGEPAPPLPAGEPVAAPKPIAPFETVWGTEGISPFPGFASVADGKLTLVSYSWRVVPMFQTRTVSMKVATPDGEQEVTKEVTETTSIWAPMDERSQIDLANCRRLAAGGAGPADEVAAMLAESSPILALSAGDKLDASVFPLLKPTAIVLEVPPSPMREPSHITCSMPPEHRLAQVQGDDVRLTSYVFETVYKDVQYQVVVDGVPETRVKKVAETVGKPIHEAMPLASLTGQLAGGEKLDAARLKTLLAKETQVLYSHYPYVDPVLLKMFKPETIVLQPPGHGHGAPVGAPAPAFDAPPSDAPASDAPAPTPPPPPRRPAPAPVPAGLPT
jgi:hypothetical protein